MGIPQASAPSRDSSSHRLWFPVELAGSPAQPSPAVVQRGQEGQGSAGSHSRSCYGKRELGWWKRALGVTGALRSQGLGSSPLAAGWPGAGRRNLCFLTAQEERV